MLTEKFINQLIKNQISFCRRQTILVETLSSKNKSTTDHDDLVKSIKDHILYPIIEVQFFFSSNQIKN